MSDFLRRIVRAARLDVTLYQEVAGDEHALWQAMAIVLSFGAASGLGVYRQTGPAHVWAYAAIELAGWFVWALIMYFLGAKLLPRPGRPVDLRTFLRTIGFSSAPGVLRVLGLLPGAALPVEFLVLVWMLIATIVAVKQVFQHVGVWPAVAVTVIAWVIVRIIQRLSYTMI